GAVGGRPAYARRRGLPAGVGTAVEPAALRVDDAGGGGDGRGYARGGRGGLVSVRVDQPAGRDESGSTPAGARGTPDHGGRPRGDGDVGGGAGGRAAPPPGGAGRRGGPGRPAPRGSLAEGRPADLLVLERHHPDPYENVCLADPSWVDLVSIGGDI